ncbi:pentatricopeptide repeat-containing protein At3g04750, mitochondrial [Cucurbita pepo subsp. pepo]|uniref:pentatricopeptide repeat-containing protein At3g04750, mitochondrial n=1 Tax=Cucurbita pepo subsp. pepo TaxID=3664 RepID=UPI000C9D77C9|nr:pentatricopeptide repeat-containing protein At3g04750, mitochondrial [Cucurbita pepo subsp. pepo]
MFRYGRGVRLLSSSSTGRRINWDPTVNLKLNHPSLVLLEKCNSRIQFKQILGHMMRNNLMGQTFPMSRLLFFSAVSHPENLEWAILLFNHFTPDPNVFIFNTMILGFSFSTEKAFSIYSSMLQKGIYPDRQTLLYLLQITKCVAELKQIHVHALVIGLLANEGYLQNSLIKMYLDNGCFGSARQMFDEMSSRDVVSYNIMIVGLAKMGDILGVLELFHDMRAHGFEPDDITMLGLFLSCGQLGEVKLGKSVHAQIVKSNGSSNLILYNALLDMYVKCNELKLARKVFDMPMEKDAVSWNTMIAGYAKVGELELACEVFNQIPTRDIVSWNSLISGYAQNGDYVMVKSLFTRMFAENVKPDKVTMVHMISAVAEMGALDQGRWIHGLAVKIQIKIDAFSGSALIDMYCKCGSIERASVVFNQISEKDVTIWTTMITGFAFHGYGNKALELFSDMQTETKPNDVTFVSVLTACSHSGLIDEGLKIFSSMKNRYSIEPGVEHFGCLVDLLCRSGRLSDAIGVVEKMPMKPSQSIWGAVLSACRMHGNMELAEKALMELLKFEPEKEGGYILLSNVYATCGRWSHSDSIREVMNSRGVKKIAGCSSVVVDGTVHDFTAANKQHPRWMDICSTLSFLTSEMKLEPDVPSQAHLANS